MQTPASPDLERYYHNHQMLAARLDWLWTKFVEYEGTTTRELAELESLVLQVRLVCEHYALLMQSACFQSLPGSERSKANQYDAIRVLASVEQSFPHVCIVPLQEVRVENGVPTLMTNATWKIDVGLFQNVYQRGGNFLHVTNRDADVARLEQYLNNAVNLVAQIIFVTWRHVVLLDGLALQIVSQVLPDKRHIGFVLQAIGESVPDLRAVRLPQSNAGGP